MKYKNIIISIIALLFFFVLANAFSYINLFSNNLDSENLTFIYPSYCYQETANSSNILDGDCNVNYTGTYSYTDTNFSNVIDSNYSTFYIGDSPTVYIYINYSKPQNLNDALWQVKDDVGFVNLSLSSCFSVDSNKLILRVGATYVGSPFIIRKVFWDCYNGTNFTTLRGDVGYYYPYEEGILWVVNQSNTQIRYINFSRNINYISSAYMNLSGFSFPYVDCYQEFANVSTSCGGLNTGSYNISGNWGTFPYVQNPPELYDGSWSSSSSPSDTNNYNILVINYTKPLKAIGAVWNVRLREGNLNKTIPRDCFLNDIVVKYNVNQSSGATSRNESLYCLNNTGWVLLFNQTTSNSRFFYEESITWNMTLDYPINFNATINNSQILFVNNFSSINITSNFYLILNSYLSSCNYTNNYCQVPFTFKTSSNGSVQYSNLNLTYSILNSNLTLPLNNSVSSDTKTFVCNASTDALQLQNITLYLWNSSNYLVNITSKNISDLVNSTNISITFSANGTYTWNCLVSDNQSHYVWADSNYTVLATTDLAVTIIPPINDRHLNYKNNIDFNCTVEGLNLDSAFLYSNFTGAFIRNQTKKGITSEVVNNFKVNLTDGTYLYTCAANKTTNPTIYYSQLGNYTITVDTVYPLVGINTISTTAGSQDAIVSANASDKNSISCHYRIYNSDGSTNGANSYVSISDCNNLFIITTSGYGTFNLSVFAVDLAGNENASTNTTFTTSPSSGTIIIGGGGGTVTPTTNASWSMQTGGLGSSYNLQMSVGTTRERQLAFKNLGEVTRTITLRCDGNLCPYIILKNTTINLPVNKDELVITFFIVNISDDLNGTYSANIIGTDDSAAINSISIDVVVSETGRIFDIADKIISSKLLFGIKVPYIFIFLAIFGLSFAFFNLVVFARLKTDAGPALSLIISIVVGLIALIFI